MKRTLATAFWKLLPWRLIVRRAAHVYGVVDPATLLARLRRFAQPSEVAEPMELVRAGILFHARGLVNTKAIQHNMDWVWPYWVERQFNPGDPSFIPRAFSFSHVNLTHRNWTAVGLPELAIYPIVDPRGLVTPLHDGWSLDFWLLSGSRALLLPSKAPTAQQRLETEDGLTVVTRVGGRDGAIEQRVGVERVEHEPMLRISLTATAASPDAWLAVAIRPYNPEGIQFIDSLECDDEARTWTVNGRTDVRFDRPADGLRTSHYRTGDVYHGLLEAPDRSRETCPVGLATAASLFRLGDDRRLEITASVPLQGELEKLTEQRPVDTVGWDRARNAAARLQVPDPRLRYLYRAAVDTLVLLTAEDAYPGVYTYRRFWFRDACLMLNALLALGFVDRCRRLLERFPDRQLRNGYFCSQHGEWDSNGQVLWILDRYSRLSGEPLPRELDAAAVAGVEWLAKKRLPRDADDGPGGLLPAGFSAEHLGPNDFYYWDDYWAVGGLRGIGSTFGRMGRAEEASKALGLADEMLESIERWLGDDPGDGLPAAPGRRMDSGAIGSLVADYPLRIYPAGDSRVARTVDYLIEHSFHDGAFFQQMIHSGLNAYLTLAVAQSLLRAGDARYEELVRVVADLASPTGQWPEAIHPNTLGGCMGDGQHGWAAAEWVMMLRNCFVREEDDELVLGSGISRSWLESGEAIAFGPTPTPWGEVELRVRPGSVGHDVEVDGRWRDAAPKMTIRIPGLPETPVDGSQRVVELVDAGEPAELGQRGLR